MVAKTDLEAREAECSNAEDYANLAREALAEPADMDYAKHLLQQAEMQSQFPVDFVKTAEVYATDLDDKEYTADLLDQAADACFDGMENATVGNAYAALLDNKERAAELFDEAKDDLSDPAQILTVAGWAANNLGNQELAAGLYEQVEASCNSLAEFSDLAKKLADAGDQDTAKTMYQKAARYVDGMEETVAYAMGAKDILGDGEWAVQLLEEAEGDAQFPKEFVALAAGIKTMTGDEDKVDELLEQGVEFAMSGEEHLDLAKGYWDLKGDKDKAAASFEQALSDISERGLLMELGKQIAVDMENPELGKQFYSKAESRVTGPGELTKLAEAVFNDLGDKQYASEIYGRAEEQIVGAHDLIGLADQVVNNLGDKDRAAGIYRKALDKSEDFQAIEKVLAATQATVSDDAELARAIFEKMKSVSESTGDLLKTQSKIREVLDNASMANTTLELAEERITNLNEMKAVVAAVTETNPDNAEWNARLAEKLEKRTANQAMYDEYQKREDECEKPSHFINLGTEVVEQLEDTFYGRKLYTAAESLLEAGQFNLAESSQLIRSVDQHISDNDWVENLFEQATARIKHFSETNQLAKLAKSLSDVNLGDKIGRKAIEAAIAGMEKAEAGAGELIKAASAVTTLFGDKKWADDLIDKARAKTENSLDLSALGKAALDIGDVDKAQDLFKQAAEKVTSASQLDSIVSRLREWGVDSDTVRSVYQKGENVFSDTQDKIEWLEGMVNHVGDQDWIRSATDGIKSMFSDEHQKKAFDARLSNLKDRDYTRPHRSTH